MQRYEVRRQTRENETIVQLVDRESEAEACLVPGIGAQCATFRVPCGAQLVDVLAPPPHLAALKADPVRYGNPILFPFPGRIREGVFTFAGRRIELPINDRAHRAAIHGLVLGKPWDVVEEGAGEEGAWVTCRLHTADHPDLEAVFPFPFEIRYTYRLREGRLESEIQVTNPGEGPLPMGLGLHPWFPLPLSDKGRRAECKLRAPVRRVWELDGLIPTGAVREAAPQRDLSRGVTLGELEFDDVYTGLNEGVGPGGWSRSTYTDPGTGVEIAVLADGRFRELVVYAPGSRGVVCLEPYTCAPNAFNLAAEGIDGGMTVLQPGEIWSAQVTYAVRAL